MRIVTQSAADSHSLFWTSPYLMLPAPKIAGLLPAPRTVPPPIEPEPFTYTSPYLSDLSEDQRGKLFDATRILLDVAVEYARETLNDHALNTAIMVFRQALTDQPIMARNPAEFNALMDAPILQYMVDQARIDAKYVHLTQDWTGDHA